MSQAGSPITLISGSVFGRRQHLMDVALVLDEWRAKARCKEPAATVAEAEQPSVVKTDF